MVRCTTTTIDNKMFNKIAYTRAAESGVSSQSWPDRDLSGPTRGSGYFACLGKVRAFDGSQNHPRVRDLETVVDVSRAEDAVNVSRDLREFKPGKHLVRERIAKSARDKRSEKRAVHVMRQSIGHVVATENARESATLMHAVRRTPSIVLVYCG